jgi:ketosteroid isomerase-like protein
MKGLAAALPVVAVLFGTPAAPAEGEVRFTGDAGKAKAVWRTFEHWLAAYSKGDLASVMAIFDRDVRFSYQGVKDQGYADLERSYIRDFRARKPGSEWVPDVEEVFADGRVAFVRAVWELRVDGVGGRKEVKGRNRSMDLLRSGPDGKWRIFRSMNYPEAAPK